MAPHMPWLPWSNSSAFLTLRPGRDCEKRQGDTLRRLGDAGVAPSLFKDLADCAVHHCAMEACVEGCHFGTLNRRLVALETGLPIMAAHPGPHWAVSARW